MGSVLGIGILLTRHSETPKLLEALGREITQKDRSLSDQMRRAMASIPLKTAEGTNSRERNIRDRLDGNVRTLWKLTH